MLTAISGFVASCSHVLTGPDHLAAVTPFSLQLRNRSWIIGLSWGLGHTIGMLLLGVVFLFFKGIIPVEFISKNSEILIGFLLIIIGVWALYRQYKPIEHGHHKHLHLHDDGKIYLHIHPHEHTIPDVTNHSHSHVLKKPQRNSAVSAVIIGVFHGLAGFSHLVAILPSLTLPSGSQSVVFLASFGAGTILTMILYTFILGAMAKKIEEKNQKRLLNWIGKISSILVICIGLIWIFLSF